MVEALFRLMLTQPFFASLLKWLHFYQDATAYADRCDRRLQHVVQPRVVDPLPLDERVASSARIAAPCFDHCGRSMSYQDQGTAPTSSRGSRPIQPGGGLRGQRDPVREHPPAQERLLDPKTPRRTSGGRHT